MVNYKNYKVWQKSHDLVSTELNLIQDEKAKYLLHEIDKIKKMLAALINKMKSRL